MLHHNTSNPSAETDPGAETVTAHEAVVVAALLVVLATAVLGANFFGGETVAPMDLLADHPGWREAGIEVDRASPHRTDILDGLLPRWLFLKRTILSGHLPTWNPLPGGGEPGWQMLFNGTLTPRFWVFLVCGNATGFGLGLIVQMVISGLGAHLLARRWTGRIGAFFAAVTFMLCGFNVSWMMWPHAATSAWIPWVVWALARAMDRPDRTSAAVLALTTSCLIFGGFPSIAAYGLYLAAAYFSVRGIALKCRGLPWNRLISLLAFSGSGLLLGVFVSAVQVMPSLEFLHHFDLGYRGPIGPLVDPRTLFFSPLAGGPPHPETTGYAGVLALALALVGAAPRASVHRTMVRVGASFWTAAAAASLILVLRFPRPVADAFYRLPGLDINPNNRLLVIYGLSIAILAGIGLGRLLAMLKAKNPAHSPGLRRWLCTAAVLLIVIQVTDLGRISRAQNAVVPAWAFFPETSVSRWLQDTLEPGQSVIAEGFLTSGTLSSYGIPQWFAHGFHTAAEKALLEDLVADAWVTPTAAFPVFPRAHLSAGELFDLLSVRFFVTPCSTARDVLASSPRSLPAHSIPLTPGLEIRQQLILDRETTVRGLAVLMNGGGSPVEGSVDVALRSDRGEYLAEASLPAHEITGITYFDFPFENELELHAGTYQVELTSHVQGQPPAVWLRPKPTGGFFVKGVPHSGALACDVLEQLVLPTPWRHALSSGGLCVFDNTRAPNGAVLINHDDPAARVDALEASGGRAQYRVTTTSAGLLVRSARFYPGWKATIDGVPAETTAFRSALQAVEVPPGESVVAWSYEPVSLKTGLIITTVSLLLLAFLLCPLRK